MPGVLVNTIDTYHLGDALTVTPQDLRFMIDINVGAALWLTQAVVPYMRERSSGSIVHMASRPGLESAAGQAAYALSKAALAYLTRLLDLELRPLGIRVNAVAQQLPSTAGSSPPDLLVHSVAPRRRSPTTSSISRAPPRRWSEVRSCPPRAPERFPREAASDAMPMWADGGWAGDLRGGEGEQGRAAGAPARPRCWRYRRAFAAAGGQVAAPHQGGGRGQRMHHLTIMGGTTDLAAVLMTRTN
jgi:NAD(P)-dependent dehydrogenase (short-subunit alcohol dehydrogenase family)